MELIIWSFIIVAVVVFFIRLMYKYTSGRYTIGASLQNRVFIVTGSSSGIGFETAQELYKHDATVVMVCRDVNKANQCADLIRSRVFSSGSLDIVQCDLSSLQSVRTCAEKLLDIHPRIHVLINNAGRGGNLGNVRSLTSDGLETTMASNYFGHFLLTHLLLQRLKETKSSRVVNVSSLMHRFCVSLDTESLNFEREPYNGVTAYCRSKLALILFAKHLATLEYGRLTVVSLNPGGVATPISQYFVRHMLGSVLGELIMPFAMLINILISKTCFEGAQTTLFLAVSPEVDIVSGKYFSDCKEKLPSVLARDAYLAKELYEKSLKLVGLNDSARVPYS